MKKVLLLFAAMCCMAMMQAEIVYHAVCEPTYMTVGYTQECWEDTENGNKLYAEEDCTTELNRAVVVTYKKLRKDPIVNTNIWGPSNPEPYLQTSQNEDDHYDGGCPFFWSVKFEFLGCYSDVAINLNTQFKVHGKDIANARLKFYWNADTYSNGQIRASNAFALNIKIGDQVVYALDHKSPVKFQDMPYHVVEVPLQGLKTDDIVTFEVIKATSWKSWGTFAACLEYTSANGGDPDVIAIETDDKRKFIGVDDPELTYTVVPASSTEKVSGINLTREPGEAPGFYTIHASQAEGANPDHEIFFYDGKLEIVDGVYHAQGETRSDGFIYLQDCWEETKTGKFYTDAYLEHELKSYEAINYPKLPSTPITATDGFTVKESATYEDVSFDWVAETTYGWWESGKRTVEFTVTEPIKYNNARLAWYFSYTSGPSFGYRNHKIYKNDVVVDSKNQEANETLPGGVFYVPLSDLKIGDKIKFEISWEGRNSTPTVAACLQYITPQDLFLKAQEAGSTVELKRNGATEPVKIQYSTDYANWTTVDFNEATTTGTITLANVGDKVYFRKADEGVASGFSNNQYQYSFAMTGKIAASGNVMSLIDNTCEATTIPNEYCFAKLFEGCTSLTQAPKLPATTLKGTCYWCMFLGCTNLTTPPVLPATTLAESCYTFMFSGCTKLATAPVLPATTLKEWCYNSMFENCTSLTTAPELPVTTLAKACYVRMFKDCTSLASAPELPATTMATQCYSGMFNGCTKLVSAPTLASASLAPTCYRGMFEGCTSLTAAPALPATELKAECYQNMFSGCTNLKSAPTLAAMKMLDYCYSNMFKDCTSLTAAPALPATTLALNCYMGMFSGCSKLESAPELPATGMYRECYKDMFKDCTSLTTAPELPATEMIYHCYYGMFSGCTKLNHVKVAFTEWTDGSTYILENWLSGVASTGTFVCPIGLDKTKTGASYIPEGWTICSPITISAAGMATLCLPFDAVCSEGVTAFYATVVDNEGVTFSPVNDGLIKAGQGVLVKGDAGSYLVEKTTGAKEPTTNYMVGVTSETEWPGTANYILVNGSEGVGFYRWDTGSLAAYKAYLPVHEGVTPSSSIAIRFDDGSTTIDDVISEPENEVIYDLQGRRVMNADKGLYIVNGKKVLKR